MRATGGLRVVPDHTFADAPPIDLLVVPGGFGTRNLLGEESTLSWIREVAVDAEQVTSVCTGSLLLASAGLLGGRRATTHWGALDTLAGLDETGSTTHPETPPVTPEPTPPPEAPAEARSFGQGIVTEKPLDEVVLEYLVDAARKRKRPAR